MGWALVMPRGMYLVRSAPKSVSVARVALTRPS